MKIQPLESNFKPYSVFPSREQTWGPDLLEDVSFRHLFLPPRGWRMGKSLQTTALGPRYSLSAL